MAQLLQVAQIGNPILRQKTKTVTDIRNSTIQVLIDNLLATVIDVNGLGIAAPQVYASSRIFILASHPNARYPNAPYMEPIAIINPKILSMSAEMYDDWEGCLSIPGIRGLIPRHVSINVEYTTREGKKEQKTFTDLIARIFQHEYDHLEGILFFDRLKSNKDIMSDKEYLKIKP